MATNANIKAALSFGSNALGITAKTIGDTQLGRIQAWFRGTHVAELGGRSSTADDLAAYMWRTLNTEVINYERGVAQQAISTPVELNE